MENKFVRFNINTEQVLTKNEFILKPEYYREINLDNCTGALSYRVFGKDLIKTLEKIEFYVEYSKQNF